MITNHVKSSQTGLDIAESGYLGVSFATSGIQSQKMWFAAFQPFMYTQRVRKVEASPIFGDDQFGNSRTQFWPTLHNRRKTAVQAIFPTFVDMLLLLAVVSDRLDVVMYWQARIMHSRTPCSLHKILPLANSKCTFGFEITSNKHTGSLTLHTSL